MGNGDCCFALFDSPRNKPRGRGSNKNNRVLDKNKDIVVTQPSSRVETKPAIPRLPNDTRAKSKSNPNLVSSGRSHRGGVTRIPSNQSEPPPAYSARSEEEVRHIFTSVETKAIAFKSEIKAFDEPSDNNKFYHIEEGLKRLIDTLDDMYHDVVGNESLRRMRSEVYKVIFRLLEELDKKLEDNKKIYQKKKKRNTVIF